MVPMFSLLFGVCYLLLMPITTSGNEEKHLVDCPYKKSKWYIEDYGLRAFLYLGVIINSRHNEFLSYNCDAELNAAYYLYNWNYKGSTEKLDFTGANGKRYFSTFDFLLDAGRHLGEIMKNRVSARPNMTPKNIGCYFRVDQKRATCFLEFKDNSI
ncbi:hypothetical protein Y032_0001g59 [Ancylostoma ceylanicum]|nr:hypothetical protein Y032_0001g59 [Ancylostoma ceylanicum]